jgi:hypothetical protein
MIPHKSPLAQQARQTLGPIVLVHLAARLENRTRFVQPQAGSKLSKHFWVNMHHS